MVFHDLRGLQTDITKYWNRNGYLDLFKYFFAKLPPELSIFHRFYKVLRTGIRWFAKWCFTNGFLAFLEDPWGASAGLSPEFPWPPESGSGLARDWVPSARDWSPEFSWPPESGSGLARDWVPSARDWSPELTGHFRFGRPSKHLIFVRVYKVSRYGGFPCPEYWNSLSFLDDSGADFAKISKIIKGSSGFIRIFNLDFHLLQKLA